MLKNGQNEEQISKENIGSIFNAINMDLKRNGNYSLNFQKLEKLSTNSIDLNSVSTYISSQNLIVEILLERGKHNEAQEILSKLLITQTKPKSTSTTTQKTKSFQYAYTIYQQAILKCQLAEFDESFNLFSNALEIVSEKDIYLEAKIQSSIGSLFWDRGKYKQAFEYQTHARSLFERLFLSNLPNNTNTTDNNNNNNIDEKKKTKPLNLIIEHLKIDDSNALLVIDYCRCLTLNAATKLKLGKLNQGLKLAQKALSFLRKALLTERHPSYAFVCSLIGMAMEKLSLYDQAIKILELAKSIQEETIGESPQYSIILRLYGSVLDYQGDYKESLKWIELALKIQAQIYGKEHPSYATTLTYLGPTLGNMGLEQKALEAFNECKRIREKVVGETSDYAAVLSNIGIIKMHQNQHTEAQALFERCLVIEEKTLGPDNLELATTINNLASVLHRKGNLDEALVQYDRSLKIQANFPDHPDRAMVMFNQSLIHESQGNLQQATRLLFECQRILKSSLGEKHKFWGHTQSAFGSIFDQEGNTAQAIEKFKSSLEIYATLGENSIEFRMTLSKLGMVFERHHQYRQALEYFEHRMRIEKNLNGMEDQKSSYERSVEKARTVRLKLVEEECKKDNDKLRLGYLQCFLGEGYSDFLTKSFFPLKKLAEFHFQSATPLPDLKYTVELAQILAEQASKNPNSALPICHLALSILHRLIADKNCVLLKPSQPTFSTCDWTYISIVRWKWIAETIRLLRLLYNPKNLENKKRAMLLCIVRTMCRDPSPNQQLFQKVFDFATNKTTLGTTTKAAFYVEQILGKKRNLMVTYARTLFRCSKFNFVDPIKKQFKEQTVYMNGFIDFKKKTHQHGEKDSGDRSNKKETRQGGNEN